MKAHASPRIPVLHFRTSDLPDAEAFARWRELMAPLFSIDRARYTSALPRGNLLVFAVGDLIVNRCTFNAQHLTRGPALIAATPDHLVLQFYRSGGFHGTVAGHPVTIVRGQVTVADLRHEIDAYAAASDTIGLSVPRILLGGIDPEALTRQLDAPRNRLLGGWMATLPRRLAQMSESDGPRIRDELTRLLSRVFSPEPVADGEDDIADDALLDQARRIIEAHLSDPDLTPDRLAALTGMSRSTLYRIFSPFGGIMRHVQERRLTAVRDALSDPLDARLLSRIAADYGFGSPALLSRAFRRRFGAPPREWRAGMSADAASEGSSRQAAHALWRDLGSG